MISAGEPKSLALLLVWPAELDSSLCRLPRPWPVGGTVPAALPVQRGWSAVSLSPRPLSALSGLRGNPGLTLRLRLPLASWQAFTVTVTLT